MFIVFTIGGKFMSMTVILGVGTTVSFVGSSACLTSVNWSFNPGRTDAFCLGSWLPSSAHVLYKPTQTLSISGYAPVLSSVSVKASTSCDNADTVGASVSAVSCDSSGSSIDISGNWFVQSYSYSKPSKDQPAQETWGLIRYDVSSFLTSQGVSQDNIVTPSKVIRGVAMGESTESSSKAGITFATMFAQAPSGSVSAGALGSASSVYHGVAIGVGGGTSDVSFKGTSSASIPYTPLYL